MEHNEAKIREIVYKNAEKTVHEMMRIYGDYIREQTIQECLGCVPLEAEFDDDEFGKHLVQMYNLCREQTINNINNLSK